MANGVDRRSLKSLEVKGRFHILLKNVFILKGQRSD